jgi:hypothetical protein
MTWRFMTWPMNSAMAVSLASASTTSRDFSSGDRIHAFVRVFQGGDAALMPVELVTEILDVTDTSHFNLPRPVPVNQFAANRGAGATIAVPLDGLKSGPYLLSVTATLPGGTKARRVLVFRVR